MSLATLGAIFLGNLSAGKDTNRGSECTTRAGRDS